MLSQEQVDLIWTLLYDEALTDEEKEFTLHWVSAPEHILLMFSRFELPLTPSLAAPEWYDAAGTLTLCRFLLQFADSVVDYLFENKIKKSLDVSNMSLVGFVAVALDLCFFSQQAAFACIERLFSYLNKLAGNIEASFTGFLIGTQRMKCLLDSI